MGRVVREGEGLARPSTQYPPGGGVLIADVHALFIPRGAPMAEWRAAPPTRLGVCYLLVLFALWILNLADLVITIHWTGSVGWAAEGNRIMRQVAHLSGPFGFMVYKVFLMSLVVLVLWWLYLRFEAGAAAARSAWTIRALVGMRSLAIGLTGGLLAFYSWVVWNNLRITGQI